MHEHEPTMTTTLDALRPIFVYGSLRKGLGNHYLLANARFDGEARTTPGFHLYDLGAFPGMIATALGRAGVVGEVYLVDGRTLARVDRLEGHPRFYCRMPIELAYGRAVETYLLRIDQVSGYDVVPGGDWLKYVEARLVKAAARRA